jgi:hypothetical protein
MGFSDVKHEAIQCLRSGAYDHAARIDIDEKNLFSAGVVDAEYVVSLISKTSGTQYECSPHHQDSTTDVHICRPFKDGCYWYVKFFFIDPDVIFISVHK